MKLTRLGEFGLISRLAKHQPQLPSTVVGIGDDCAVLEGQGKYLLITTDALVEGVHFRRKGLSFFALGQKALAANISDIAAMGGWPTHAVVTVGLPRSLSVKSVDDLYRGFNSLAKQHRIDLVGGDTVASPKALFISITLLGEVEKKNLVLRSTAKVGDLICVTGRFGGPAKAKFVPRPLFLVPRLKEARTLAKIRMATAMIDSSDGLVRSVLELCKASKVGARIFTDQVPVAKGATLDQALYGGEEYELVFTTRPGRQPKAKGLRYSIVGEIVGRRSGVKLVDKRGKIKEPRSGGYEHFR
jgi:thiamine-monophosphate kinase